MATLRVRYQTLEVGDVDIHVRSLRDNQQYEDDDGAAEDLGISSAMWPIFGMIWDSSIVLAHLMNEHEIAGLRILEVGCGIGLTSLLLNHREADITATDRHPRAGAFLARNAALNHGNPIPFVRAGWADEVTSLGTFDLIVGSDLLYQPNHPELLADFVERHAKPTCEVILVDPGRGMFNKFTRRMTEHGFEHERRQADNIESLSEDFSARVLTYRRRAAG